MTREQYDIILSELIKVISDMGLKEFKKTSMFMSSKTKVTQ